MKKYPIPVRMLLGALILVAIPALVAAQQPDLSGTWVLNQEKSTIPQTSAGGRGGFGGGASADMTIKVEGGNILITTTRPGRGGGSPTQSTDTYIPDGKPHTVEAAGGRGGSSEVVAAWKDGKLVVSSTRAMRDQSMTTTEMYSIQADGTLLVERQMPAMGGGGGGTMKLVYDKK